MIDVIDALRELLEPDPTDVVRDQTAAEPFIWQPNHLYVFPGGPDAHVLAGAGDPAPEQENFVVNAVYVAPASDEEAKERRLRSVSELLDEKAHAYCTAIANNRSRYHDQTPAPWQQIQAVIDHDFIRTLRVRGVAVRISGYRVIPLGG